MSRGSRRWGGAVALLAIVLLIGQARSDAGLQVLTDQSTGVWVEVGQDSRLEAPGDSIFRMARGSRYRLDSVDAKAVALTFERGRMAAGTRPGAPVVEVSTPVGKVRASRGQFVLVSDGHEVDFRVFEGDARLIAGTDRAARGEGRDAFGEADRAVFEVPSVVRASTEDRAVESTSLHEEDPEMFDPSVASSPLHEDPWDPAVADTSMAAPLVAAVASLVGPVSAGTALATAAAVLAANPADDQKVIEPASP